MTGGKPFAVPLHVTLSRRQSITEKRGPYKGRCASQRGLGDAAGLLAMHVGHPL
jgi:hypothetical protein